MVSFRRSGTKSKSQNPIQMLSDSPHSGPLFRRGFSNDFWFSTHLGHVWWVSSNSHFYILKNITHISTHFFTHMYFKKCQTTILKLLYQTPHCSLFRLFWAQPIYLVQNNFKLHMLRKQNCVQLYMKWTELAYNVLEGPLEIQAKSEVWNEKNIIQSNIFSIG